MDKQQKIVRFYGNVQGVGFRYAACRTAGLYDVTGYVRNLDDGSVECVAEGPSQDVDDFLADLTQRMGQYIRRQTQQTAPYSGQFNGFDVRH
jgi:acylphosphatase